MSLVKKIRTLAALGLLSTGTAAAFAQGDRTQQQQGASTGVAAQAGIYGGIQQSPWFGNPSIRQQLQLNDDQYNRMNKSYGQAWDRYNKGLTGLDKNLAEQQRMQRYQELNGGFYKDFSGGIDEVFPDKAARQRYNQMDWQYRGYGAFNDPYVQKQLSLNEEQRQKFNQYDREWNTQMNNWRREFRNDRDGIANRFRESRRELQNRINSTLTPEQRTMWTDMNGKPFDFSPDVYFESDSNSQPNAK